MAIFPDRWGVVAAISGFSTIFSLGGIMEFYEFPIIAVEPLTFGIISGVYAQSLGAFIETLSLIKFNRLQREVRL